MVQQLLELFKPELTEQELIKFLTAQGITVKTNTKARGNLGICFKNRIDISKKVAKERRLSILIHEYAHKIHYDLEKEAFNKGGSLEKLFKTDSRDLYFQELILITNFIDENSQFKTFYTKKAEIKAEIKNLEQIIRKNYPDFKKTEDFKHIKSYFRKNNSPAKYLLKYDNVRFRQPIPDREDFYSIKNLDKDFPEIPEPLRAYIKFRSKDREYKRLYRLKNKADRYYKKPTELFARFIECVFNDPDKVLELAPITYGRFKGLLNQNYYGNLKELFKIAGIF